MKLRRRKRERTTASIQTPKKTSSTGRPKFPRKKVMQRNMPDSKGLSHPHTRQFTKQEVQHLYQNTVQWVSPGCVANGCRVVRRSAFLESLQPPKRGAGLVAMRDFSAGEGIACYTGEIITGRAADSQRWDNNYLFELDNDKVVIDAQNPRFASVARYINAPVKQSDINSAFTRAHGRVVLVTTKDVKLGEEFIAFYGMDQEVILL